VPFFRKLIGLWHPAPLFCSRSSKEIVVFGGTRWRRHHEPVEPAFDPACEAALVTGAIAFDMFGCYRGLSLPPNEHRAPGKGDNWSV